MTSSRPVAVVLATPVPCGQVIISKERSIELMPFKVLLNTNNTDERAFCYSLFILKINY
jgi:hypothetical protein